jgi:response regulator RpfG family c-di-GMP phosphodiesterase
MTKKSVLIVNNESSVRDMLVNLFTDVDFHVSLADNGTQALQIVANSTPDFILCEQFLPDGSGVELKRRILRVSPKSCVIVLSSFSVIRTSDDVLRFGSSDFIIDQREFLDILLAAGEDMGPVELPVTDLHLKKCLIETIDVLVGLLEINDPFFGGNSHITMQYARAVAEEMNLSPEMVDEIVVASLLHDIGRIGIRADILTEKKDISDREYSSVKSHCENGTKILESIEFPWKIKPIIVHHHERYDGKGYPSGLKGRQIPVGARILSVVDAYAAMTANRPYRRSRQKEESIEELHRNVGSQFDPEIVEIFTRVLEQKFYYHGIGAKPKILMVDDEVDFLTLLKLKLVNEGFDVIVTDSPTEALSYVEKSQPDLVIADVMMPEMDGIAMYKKMREISGVGDTPLLFLSVNDETNTKVEALHLGAEDYLVKPVDLRELAARIRNIIRRDKKGKKEISAGGAVQGVMGDLKNLGIPEIVQTLHLGLKTACVTLKAGEGDGGRIYFTNGRISHCETENLKGEDAFYRLLRLQEGSFVISHSQTATERTIDMDEMQLILEGFRRIDEEKKETTSG